MILKLTHIPPLTGIYTVKGVRDSLPESFLRMHPEAWAALKVIEDSTPLVYSDIYRTAEQSREARRLKTGVQKPGYSGHNFGVSVDVAVDATLARHKWTYQQLWQRLKDAGWSCFRSRATRGFEDWHFNWSNEHGQRSAENVIQRLYGDQLKLNDTDTQIALQKVGFYGGAIDGIFGPRSKSGLDAFARAWGATSDSEARRMLAYVTAQIVYV
jgi:hypothetical protein